MAKAKGGSGEGKPEAPAKSHKRSASNQDQPLGVLGFEPALIDGEDLTAYEAFRAAALEVIVPKDAIERVWLQDFLDYTWEA